jgi:hypothetical protein
MADSMGLLWDDSTADSLAFGDREGFLLSSSWREEVASGSMAASGTAEIM